MRARRAVLGAALLLAPGPAGARSLLTQEEALAVAFPRAAQVVRENHFLTSEQLEEARRLSEVPIGLELWTRYVGVLDGKVVGTAYFDTHLVRTLPETLLIVVGAEGRVERVEVVAFAEPPDYLPRPAWYGQFQGRRLDGELTIRRGIRSVTGATLSARAATDAVRRVLAIHGVLPPPGSPEAPTGAGRAGEGRP
jgi:hypothetical protein